MEPRLLNTTTLTFELPLQTQQEKVASEQDPRRQYAILSHCWARNNDHEVKYDDILSGWKRQKPGFAKLEGAARKAKEDGFDWIWIDTCCIDKRSSAETAEAINSMYRWYQEAEICYVYLEDVDPGSVRSFRQSRWFTRGWTLQELIAPKDVDFFDCDWTHLGSKTELASEISRSTGIHAELLLDYDYRNGCNDRRIDNYSIAQKMSWAANRKTTKPEDMAYCLLGIFDVNMVPMYGEGEKAFMRLQEELIRNSDDHTIFAWSMESLKTRFSSLLAPNARCFVHCSGSTLSNGLKGREPFSITNRGLSIELEITPWTLDTYLAFIDCEQEMAVQGSDYKIQAGVFLRRLGQDDQYARHDLYNDGGLYWDIHGTYEACRDEFYPRPSRSVRLFISTTPDLQSSSIYSAVGKPGFCISASLCQGHEGTDGIYIPILEPCQLEIRQLRDGLRFKQIALGFDFGFNPVCMLADSDAENELVGPISTFYDDDQEIYGKKYDTIVEGSCVYSGGKPHDGFWRLRCNRRLELDVVLKVSPSHSGPNLLIRREKNALVWNVYLEDAQLEQNGGEDSDPHGEIMDLMDAETLDRC